MFETSLTEVKVGEILFTDWTLAPAIRTNESGVSG
jgi:hypothetical protein